MIEIVISGPLNTVQDSGRFAWLAAGVSIGGAMDRMAHETGNLLLGNAHDAAAIEVQLFPFRLRAEADTEVVVTGAACAASIDGVPLPTWFAVPLRKGQTLALAQPRSGARAYVAFRGGIDVPLVLGSRSTDARRGFGGFGGRGLSRGDRLCLEPPSVALDAGCRAGLGAVPPERSRTSDAGGASVLRVLPAAEHDDFTEGARDAFVSSDWTVTAEANRMGYHLSGPALILRRPLELFSHGIVPGTIQVPPAGQPIIQAADGNTCGGYPKIATVIEADLWRLAQTSAGGTIRFEVVSEDTAVDALRTQARWVADLAAQKAALER